MKKEMLGLLRVLFVGTIMLSWFLMDKSNYKNYFLFLVVIALSPLAFEIIIIIFRRSGKTKKVNKTRKTVSNPRKKLSDEELIFSNIDTLSGQDFERLMELYYRYKGYEVKRVGGSGDHEVDLI